MRRAGATPDSASPSSAPSSADPQGPPRRSGSVTMLLVDFPGRDVRTVRVHRPGPVRALLLALLAAFPWRAPEAAAVSPDRPLKQYSRSPGETRDGLPHKTVPAPAPTPGRTLGA